MVRDRRFKSEVWNHFEIIGKRSICKFCGKDSYKNPSRMPLHLTKCPKCPEPIREKMLTALPKSLSKTTPTSSHCVMGSNLYDIADIEVVNEEEVTNTSLLQNRCSYISKNDDSSSVSQLYDDKPEDEFALFGKSVAHKLRNISNARARVVAQYYINTVLFRAEMTNFNEDILSLPNPQEFTLFDSIRQENGNKDNQAEIIQTAELIS